MAYALKEHGLSESYVCDEKRIVDSGIYHTEHIDANGSETVVAKLYGILIPREISEDEVKELKKKVDRALAGCTHCKYHAPKSHASS